MVSDADLAALSRTYPVLQAFGPQPLQTLRENVTSFSAPAGRLVFHVGAACNGLPFLGRGTIRVVSYGADGREMLVYKLNPGEGCILSICCLFGRTSYPAAVLAETDIAGLILAKPGFFELVSESEPFRKFIFDMFATRIASLIQLIGELAFQKVDERLATLLLGRGRAIEATHQQLADELGTAREVVSRILKRFEVDGFVRLGRGTIEIVDPAGLRHSAPAE